MTWRRIGGLLGKLDKRPGLEIVRHEAKPELARGMKVRSSVKKLCDGCKVGGLSCMPFEGKSGELIVEADLFVSCRV